MTIMTVLHHVLRKPASGLLLLLLVLTCLPLQAAEPLPQCERPARLRLSVIPLGETQDNQAAYQPLVDDLQQSLNIPIELVVPASYGSVIEGLLSGAIDLARMGPASYISVSNSDARIVPFAALIRDQDLFNDNNPAGYYSVLVTRQKGSIKSREDLQGKRLSLVDPDSTSGATIPRHYFLRDSGMAFDRYFSRIAYSGNHEQSVLSVLANEVDAAFVSSNILSALILSGKIMRDDIRILWKSSPIPYSPFVYRGQLCADIKQKIRTVFFNKQSPNRASTLTNLNAHAFAPVTESDYRILRELPR